jgi:hypothetical protein
LEVSKIEELKIRMASLQKAPVFAKIEAGAELMQCAVELLEQQEARLNDLEQRVIEGSAQ